MELLLNLTRFNMQLKISKQKAKKTGKAIFCITIGTISGILTYYLFLYFNIAIFGWNLGLIFAPLVAGYVETYLAIKLVNESIGAISAFILFIVTVVYGFIIANPTLGPNIITVGSVLVITQAAFPTLINYILLVVVLGIFSYFLGIFKKITDNAYYGLKKFIYHKILKKEHVVKVSKKEFVNDYGNCIEINSRGFSFNTTTHPINGEVKEYLGLYVGSSTFQKRPAMVCVDYKQEEKDMLNKLKIAKNNALLNLADLIEQAGGNGVLDLKIEYELVDMGKGEYQVLAHGTGVIIEK